MGSRTKLHLACFPLRLAILHMSAVSEGSLGHSNHFADLVKKKALGS